MRLQISTTGKLTFGGRFDPLTGELRVGDAQVLPHGSGISPSPPASFDPSQVAAFGRWYDVAQSGRFTDSGGTTPATATYNPIGALNDKGAGAANILQATSGNRPKLVLEGNIPYLVFDGVNSVLKTAGNVTRGPFTIVAVVRARGGTGVMWHHGSALLASNEDWNSNTTTNSCYTSRSGSAAANTLPSTLADNTWRVVTIRFDGSLMSYRINGVAASLNTAAAALGTSTFAAPLSLGAATDGQFPCAVDIAAWVDYDAAISDSDAALVEDYFNTARGFGVYGFTPTANLIADGNSWTRGYGASSVGLGYITQLANLLGPSYGAIANFGVDGQTITQMDADAGTQIDPLFLGGGIVNYLLVLEGYNEIHTGGKTAAEAYANTVTYCSNRRTGAGAKTLKILIGTPPVGTDTATNDYAAMIRADHSFADALVDFNLQSTSIMADSGDGLHPGDAGYGIMASMASSVFSSPPPAAPVVNSVTLDNTSPDAGDVSGDTITATASGTNCDTFTYQWKADGVAISGATSQSYQATRADALGHALTCEAVGHNTGGDSDPVESSATSIVTGRPMPVDGPVAETDGANAPDGPVDSSLSNHVSSTDGTWTAYPAPTFTYSWVASGAVHHDEQSTSNSYPPSQPDYADAESSYSVACQVTATNTVGSNVNTSNSLTVI